MKIDSNALRQDRPDLWDRFTRREEYEVPIRDMHGRFPYWASRDRDIFRPSVSGFLYEHGLIKPEYPDGCEFALCVTHDIDAVYSAPYMKILNGLRSARRGDLKGFARETCSVLDRKSPLYNFMDILSEGVAQLRTPFQLLC